MPPPGKFSDALSGLPESPGKTAKAALGKLKDGIKGTGLKDILGGIEDNPALSQVDKLGKQLEAITLVFSEKGKEIGKQMEEISNEVKSVFEDLLVSLGFEKKDAEAFYPGAGLPDEENISDEVTERTKNKITPEQEKDIIGFMQEKGWLNYAERACAKFGVPLFVLLAVIRCESGFRSDAPTYNDPLTKKPASSALGLGQFMNGDWGLRLDKSTGKLVRRTDGEGFLNASADENPWGYNADRLNPEHNLWATARHIRNKVAEANSWVDRGRFPTSYRLKLETAEPKDVKWIYMSYMNGAWGYLVMRRYLENPTPENYENLTWFQKREWNDPATGKKLRSTHIEAAQRCSDRGAEKAAKFASQILEKNPALAKIHLSKTEAVG